MEIEKHLILTGTSTYSWKDAIVKTISETAKTVDNITSVQILDQRASINGEKLYEYFVDLDISFMVDLERKNNA